MRTRLIEEMAPEDIRVLRRTVAENVATFGRRFGRSGRTVEDWEQGRRRPNLLTMRALVALARRVTLHAHVVM